MAATAGLSIAANAFAVVGIAEVVCRTGKDLYDVLCKLRHASTEVDHLLSTIRVLRSSTDAARQYLSDVVQLPRTQATEAAVTQLTNLLNAIHTELIKLTSIDKKTISSWKQTPAIAKGFGCCPAYTEMINLRMQYEHVDANLADKYLKSFFMRCPTTLGNLTREAIGTATALLSSGTNPQLVDSHGRNILHWSFWGELGLQCKITYEISTLLSTTLFNEDAPKRLDSFNMRLSLNHHGEKAVITAGLRSGADPNALSHSGRPPFCFTTKEQFLSTALHLKSLGYLYVKVPRVWLYDAGIVLMKDSEDKLPVSGLGIAEYLQERDKIRQSVVSTLWEKSYWTFVLHAKWNKVRRDKHLEPVRVDVDELELLAREFEWEIAMVSIKCGPMDYMDDEEDYFEPTRPCHHPPGLDCHSSGWQSPSLRYSKSLDTFFGKYADVGEGSESLTLSRPRGQVWG